MHPQIEAIEETEETLTPVRETPGETPMETAEPAEPRETTQSPAAAAAAPAASHGGARRRDPIPSHVVKMAAKPAAKKEPIKMNPPLPRRNVQSKLRTLLEAPTAPAAGAAAAETTRRPPRTPRKGRWDAVMSRIEQNKCEEKTRPRREVKSRLMEGVSGPAGGAQGGTRRTLLR